VRARAFARWTLRREHPASLASRASDGLSSPISINRPSARSTSDSARVTLPALRSASRRWNHSCCICSPPKGRSQAKSERSRLRVAFGSSCGRMDLRDTSSQVLGRLLAGSAALSIRPSDRSAPCVDSPRRVQRGRGRGAVQPPPLCPIKFPVRLWSCPLPRLSGACHKCSCQAWIFLGRPTWVSY
jgi:hypothetical protein